MQRRLFYIGLVMVVMLIFSSSVFGAETEKISLLDAVDFTLQHNLDLEVERIKLYQAELDYQKAQANNLLTESRYIGQQNELALAQAKDSYLQTKNGIIISTVQDYLQVSQLEQEITIKKKQLELETRILADTETQLREGHLGQLDLLKQEVKYHNAGFDVEKAEDDYQQVVKQLKTTLGLDQTLEVKGLTMGEFQIPEISESQAIEAAVLTSFKLAMRADQIELAELDLERAKSKTTPQLDLEKIKADLQLAKLNHQKAQQDVETEVKNQYYLFRQAVKRLDLSQQNYRIAEENYQITKKQHLSGLKTENDLLLAELNLLQEGYDQFSAKKNVLSNLLQLEKIMGREIEVIVDEIFI